MFPFSFFVYVNNFKPKIIILPLYYGISTSRYIFISSTYTTPCSNYTISFTAYYLNRNPNKRFRIFFTRNYSVSIR